MTTEAMKATVAPAHPWVKTARTILAVVVGLAAGLPGILAAAGFTDAVPWVATTLGVCAMVTRGMATPTAELIFRKLLPIMAANDVEAGKVVAQVTEGGSVVAGPAHVERTGKELENGVDVVEVPSPPADEPPTPKPRKRAAARKPAKRARRDAGVWSVNTAATVGVFILTALLVAWAFGWIEPPPR